MSEQNSVTEMASVLNLENARRLEKIFFEELIKRKNNYIRVEKIEDKSIIFLSDIVLEDVSVSIDLLLMEIEKMFGKTLHNNLIEKYQIHINHALSNLQIELLEYDNRILKIVENCKYHCDNSENKLIERGGSGLGNFIAGTVGTVEYTKSMKKSKSKTGDFVAKVSSGLKSDAVRIGMNILESEVRKEEIKTKYIKILTTCINNIIHSIENFYYNSIFNELYNLLKENQLVDTKFSLEELTKLDITIDFLRSKKNYWLILGLAILLPSLHRFYAGKIITGLIFFFTFGGIGIWYILDIIKILMCKFKDSEERYISYKRVSKLEV